MLLEKWQIFKNFEYKEIVYLKVMKKKFMNLKEHNHSSKIAPTLRFSKSLFESSF